MCSTQMRKPSLVMLADVSWRDYVYAGEQQEQAALRAEAAEAAEAGSTPQVGLTHRMRHRDSLVLGMLTLQALLGALCLALQGRIHGIQRSQQWTASRASGRAQDFLGVLRLRLSEA